MRDQLRPFEGQLVFIEGRLTEASRRDDKQYFMMRRPKITPWDGISAVDFRNPATSVDHLWVDLGSGGVQMLQHCFTLTRIRYYTRSNGSVDLGCEPIYHILDFDKYQIDFHDSCHSGYHRQLDEQLHHLNQALSIIDWHGKVMPGHTEPSYGFSRFKTVPWMRRYFKNAQQKALRLQTAQLKAKAGDRGKQRPCRSAGSFADLLR